MSATTVADAGFATLLPLTALTPGSNDRRYFDPAELAALASSIASHGLAQPITVRPLRGGFEIVAGERRYRAHLLLAGAGRSVARRVERGMDASAELVECLVRPMTDEDASAVMLAENTARADLGPLEEACAYRVRMDRYGIDAATVARWAGVTTYRVTCRLRLLALTDEGAALVRAGDLPVGHAQRLADLDPNRQALMLAAWASSGGTIHAAGWAALVGGRLAEQNAEAMFDVESFLTVATMAESVQAREPSTKILRRHLQAAVRAMETAGVAPRLCAEIRSTWPRSWAIAENRAAQAANEQRRELTQ